MKRNAWLIAAVAAAFWLRMPVCMLACIDSPPTPPAHAGAAPPCHGAPPPADEPEGAHHDCDCDHFRAAVAKANAKPSGRELGHLAFASLPAIALPSAPNTRSVPAWQRPSDLPPPDLLLLNATLLL